MSAHMSREEIRTNVVRTLTLAGIPVIGPEVLTPIIDAALALRAADRVVFRDDSEEPITAAEGKVLRQCGLLHTMAVNGRWHAKGTREMVMEVLDSVRGGAA